MLPSMSTHLFAFGHLRAHHLHWIAEAGFRHIELWGAKPHFNFQDEKESKRVIGWIQEAGLRTATIHLPFYTEFGSADSRYISLTDRDDESRLLMGSFCRRLVDLCVPLGCHLVVLHPVGELHNGDTLNRLRRELDWFVPYCQEREVRIALENIMLPHTRIAHLAQLCREYQPDVGICLDIGHAHIRGGVEAEIEAGGPYIRNLHVHDNHGKADEHLLPGEGLIDWPGTISALAKEAPNCEYFTFELMIPLLEGAEQEKVIRQATADSWSFWQLYHGQLA